jgi:glyoxylase-like metal-dependent hydrolase (beta-lactamase superfamily II)
MAEKLIHEILPVGMLQCNCSILGDPATREAIVVDPGDETGRILEILKSHNLNVRAIVSTHTHIDHVGGLALLHKATGAPVLIHEADLELYRHLDMQAQFLGMRTPESTRIEDFVKEGDTLRWGPYSARVIHTPGHTPGSISLYVEKSGAPDQSYLEEARHAAIQYPAVLSRVMAHAVLHLKDASRPKPAKASAQAHLQADLQNPAREPAHSHDHAHAHGHVHTNVDSATRLIAGDTLFQGSIGRTDLWGGSMNDIMNSIRGKLLALPDETLVIPGHGDTTTIGAERAENPYLR